MADELHEAVGEHREALETWAESDVPLADCVTQLLAEVDRD